MSTMTSRQRLLGALRRERIDRVPLSTYEMVGYDFQSWYAQQPSYARLLQYIREKTDCVYVYGIPGLYRMDPAIKVDQLREETPEGACTRTTIHTPLGPLTRTQLVKPGIHTTWQTEHLLKSVEDVERYKSIRWVRREQAPDYGKFREMDRDLGDHGLPAPDCGDAFCTVADLFAFGEYTIMALTETELLRGLVEAQHARVMDTLRSALDAGFHGLFRICGSEYGAAPYVPPRVWHALEGPYLKEMIDLIHSYPNCFARIHSHGRYRGLLDGFKTCAPAAIDPCEPPPDGDMTLAELKSEIGGRTCLMGAMELKVLETGTPEIIRREVEQSMAMAKPGGGYIAISTASPINMPLARRTEENYYAWIDANLELGRY